MRDNIMVSVRCLCFNHEKYLRDALDGILMQITNFKYEIVIHDDASTDNSQHIIQEYAERYPDIIIPILQKENQYSKNVSIDKEYLMPKVRGKYSAFCECDDFWTDPYKLQKQFDFLENNPEYSMCCHAYKTVDGNGQNIREIHRSIRNNHDIQPIDVIMNNEIPQTATFFHRTEQWPDMPDFFFNCMVGDYPLIMYMRSLGKIYYFDECMSAYRIHSDGSWVQSTRKDVKKFREHVRLLQKFLDEYDRYTCYTYHKSIEMRKSHCEYVALENELDINGIKKNAYFHSLVLQNRFIVLLKLYKQKFHKKLKGE